MESVRNLTPDSVLESVPTPAEIRLLIKQSVRHSAALRTLLRAAEARDRLRLDSLRENSDAK